MRTFWPVYNKKNSFKTLYPLSTRKNTTGNCHGRPRKSGERWHFIELLCMSIFFLILSLCNSFSLSFTFLILVSLCVKDYKPTTLKNPLKNPTHTLILLLVSLFSYANYSCINMQSNGNSLVIEQLSTCYF